MMGWRRRWSRRFSPVGTKGGLQPFASFGHTCLLRFGFWKYELCLSHVEMIAPLTRTIHTTLIHTLASLPPFTAPSPSYSFVVAFTKLFICASIHLAVHSRQLFIRGGHFIRGFLYDWNPTGFHPFCIYHNATSLGVGVEMEVRFLQ